MSTPFAVATPRQAQVLRAVREGKHTTADPAAGTYSNGWIGHPLPDDPIWKGDGQIPMRITDAGRVALELREILGPDRNLTRPQARALTRQDSGRVYRFCRSLLGLGLIDTGDALTEDGQRIAEVLRKYRVEL